MEKRFPGEITTYETRGESNDLVDRQLRYRQIVECLTEALKVNINGLSAKEIACMMQKKGYIPTSERNFTAPRLTEMMDKGIVEPLGKSKCIYTGRRVTVYGIRNIGGFKVGGAQNVRKNNN